MNYFVISSRKEFDLGQQNSVVNGGNMSAAYLQIRKEIEYRIFK